MNTRTASCFFFLLLINPLQGSTQENILPDILKADELVRTFTSDNLAQAIGTYKKTLETSPNNYEILWRLARAYDAVLDITTNQAIITIDGLTDTEEHKKLWRKYGKFALTCSQQARLINPDGIDGMVWQAISYAYYSSSFGIVKAVFSGAAGKFKENAQLLITKAPDQMGALGYRHMGIFYLAAPFPLGSPAKAARYMKQALSVDSPYLQNHYYYGLSLYRLKKYQQAKSEFEFVLNNPPQPDEKQCDLVFKAEARKFITRIAQQK